MTHKQLVEYITGIDTRIGYPNEHLAGNSDEEISSPLYATAVGLVLNSIQNKTQSAVRIQAQEAPRTVSYTQPVVEQKSEEPPTVVEQIPEVIFQNNNEESTQTKISRSFFDKYVDKIKDFLDKAE